MKKLGITVLSLCAVMSGFSQTNDAAFFRISSPPNTLITEFDALAGTISWSNDVAGVTNQLQRAYMLDGVSNWVDFVKMVTPGGSQTGTERIIDLDPPEGMVLIPGGINYGTNPLGPGEIYNSYYLENYELSLDAFYMDQMEVTNDEMVQVMQWAYDNGKLTVSSSSVQNAEGNPKELLNLDSTYCRITWDGSTFGMKPEKGSGYPCVEVSWFGAAAYCNYKSEMEGLTPCYNLNNWSCNESAGGYRLPTGDEWEIAARGGLTSERFEWGDTISHTNANYYGASNYYSYDYSSGYHPDYKYAAPYTSPGGSFEANGYGLYDMTGNVWEWTNDWFPGMTGSFRLVRGGGWNGNGKSCRVGGIFRRAPTGLSMSYGFRALLPAD